MEKKYFPEKDLKKNTKYQFKKKRFFLKKKMIIKKKTKNNYFIFKNFS